MTFARYAIYYLPPPGPLAAFGTSWLGWDCRSGQDALPPKLDDLPAPWDQITKIPRKYGFHATLKPPFRLAEGHTELRLVSAFSEFCVSCGPVQAEGLELTQLGRFLALVPMGDTRDLTDLAEHIVRAFDPFRAPMSEAELVRRRASGLTSEQDALLQKWGYPYVMDQFRLHMTLSAKLPKAQATALKGVLTPHFAHVLPRPFVIDQLCLVGEGADGRFHLISNAPLSGG